MQIKETRDKQLNLAKATLQSSREAVRFSKEHLTALNMGNEPEEQEDIWMDIDPTRYLNRRETMLWNRLSRSQQEYYIREGMTEAEHTVKSRKGISAGADEVEVISERTAYAYRMENPVSEEVGDLQGELQSNIQNHGIQGIHEFESYGQTLPEQEFSGIQRILYGKLAGNRSRQWKGRYPVTKHEQKHMGNPWNSNQMIKNRQEKGTRTRSRSGISDGHTTMQNVSVSATESVAASTTAPATGGASIAWNAGKKAADKFKAYMQEKAMATEQAMQDVEKRLNNSREVNHAMDTMPEAVRYTAATIGVVVTVVSAAVVQAVFSFLTAIIAAVLAVFIPLIAVIALVATLIGILVSLSSDTQAGHGLPTFVTEEMMQAFFETQQESGIPVSSGIAQLIVESGFGSYGPGGEEGQGMSQLAYEYKNLFGIKYFSGDQFASGGVNMSTGEETSAGNIIIDADFAVYPDYQSCIKQRAWMLRRSPYEPHLSPYLNRNDGSYSKEEAQHFVEGIRAAGWATAQAYVDHCFSVMERYNLYQFDNMTWEQYQDSMAGGGSYDGTVTPLMQTIVDIAKNNGSTYPCTPDMCAAWVTGVYQVAGVSEIPYGDAIDMWNTYQNTGSTSMDNIPPGAIVCGSGSGYMGSLYGHVGIYIGDGMVANNVGHFSIESLSNWISWQTATCQGHTGWIGWIYPGGVPK